MYLRISQEKKEERDTLDNHRQILIEFCKNNNWTYEIYGEVLSGGLSDIGQRPQLQRLLKEIERFDGILVFELSRLSRNGLISETVLQYCQDYNKPVITPHQTYDLANNENDVLIYRFGSIISSQEHKAIGRRSKSNKIAMAKQGMFVSGVPPFGYRRDETTKRLVIHEEESKVVRRVFELHKQGKGLTVICDYLNKEGYKPQRSRYWNTQTVKKILTNPAYKGTVVFQDLKKVKENGKYIYKVMETISVDNAHPPIISPNEFDLTIKDRSSRNEHLREKPSKYIKTMVKDIVFCGICGAKVTFSLERNGKITIKPCKNRVNGVKCNNSGVLVQYLEEDILEHIKKYENDLKEELQKLEYHDTSSLENDLKERIQHIENQLELNKERQKSLLDLALDGVFSREELSEKKQELNDQQEELLVSLKLTKEQLETIDPSSTQETIETVLKMLRNFENLNVDEQNTILKSVIKKVYFTRNIPNEIRQLSPMKPLRRTFPYEYEIEYF